MNGRATTWLALGLASACWGAAAVPLAAQAASHGIAMYGEPALPQDFVSLPYANPDAPKGGRIVFGEQGTFDSLNPYIVRGNAPTLIAALTSETLMGRSYDEPFTLYGLLAESVATDEARSYAEFTLRENARFSDGTPVTVDDVIWSMETLGTQGQPRYAAAWAKIARTERTGPRSVRFTFAVRDRELPLILGLRPILKKAQWEGRDFTRSSLEAPIGSGPYVVGEVEPGRFITYVKNPDWWGADLPFNRGQYNFDSIRIDYFADANVIFEAFKAGELSVFREGSVARWNAGYDIPAVRDGRVTRSEVPHRRPSGIAGLAFNTRRAIFADWRVREALIQAFNFELINRTVTGGSEPRILSYFSNSELGMTPGTPATGAEAGMLALYPGPYLPGVVEGYALPVSDGTEANRRGIRTALRLLEEAGWTTRDGVLVNAAGEPFAFEILLQQGGAEMMAVANIYTEALARLGIAVRIAQVDAAQYRERTNRYDFDMTSYARALSLSPGNEQTLYWGSAGVTEPGTGNWMGMNEPGAELMIRTMLAATDRTAFVAATRALDRILTAGRYVIPIWYADRSRIAHDSRLRYPDRVPLYGDFIGFLPNVWWYGDPR